MKKLIPGEENRVQDFDEKKLKFDNFDFENVNFFTNNYKNLKNININIKKGDKA